MLEVSEQFKAFRDPSFHEFTQIVGKEHDPELPLYAQLYILKEEMAFYTYFYNAAFP
jgi:hypothetical protein